MKLSAKISKHKSISKVQNLSRCKSVELYRLQLSTAYLYSCIWLLGAAKVAELSDLIIIQKNS